MFTHKITILLGLFFTCVSCTTSNDFYVSPQSHKNDINVIELTIGETHEALRSNEFSCEQLVRRYIERINAYDQATLLNSIITINPNAINKARWLDAKQAKSLPMKKLHCIPVILKDNFDTADMPTEAGSIAMKGSLPPDDAFMVKRLRQEDAIILAKSNMGEWAFSPYNTISSTHGETRNAYDLNRVPAGSSGGTASAIAANLGIIGMGTDTGNSIRGPASHLSLVGIRSTMGLTSRDGIVPLVLNRDIGGPLMRTVKDTAIVFSVIAGYDPADDLTHILLKDSAHTAEIDYSDYLNVDGLQGVRLGVIRQLYETATADPEMLAIMERAMKDLKNAGAVIIDPFEVNEFNQLKDATGFCSRFYFDLNNYLDKMAPHAPVNTLDDIVINELFRPQNRDAMDWAMSETGDPSLQSPPCVNVAGDHRRQVFLDAVVYAMDEANVDAIIYPSWSNPPRALQDSVSPHGNNSPVIAPHTGQPAITVPMGFTREGLPAGLQMLARPFHDHKLIQYAYSYEQATQHRQPPPAFGTMDKTEAVVRR